MATSLHTLIDIFDKEFDNEGETVLLKDIVIPIIQRDYAQGRTGAEVVRVRKRFLNALHHAVCDKPITLDFVYGDIDANGRMTPLDGQQRLTTLFLLHWYAVKKEHIPSDEYGFLNHFSYETRYSARDFCASLIGYEPTFSMPLSEEIMDQPWFPMEWKNDPTISAMLVMLDTIAEVFSDVDDLWGKLKNKAISFYFLPIRDMGLTDELYIKMNSRGKPLTMFEHFKAELEHELRIINKDDAKRIISKIDREWTDMLWMYRGDDNVIDDEFLRYFRFLCDIICYKQNDTPQGKEYDEFDLLEKYFSGDSKNVSENITFLESGYDCWCAVKANGGIREFFEKYLVEKEHETGKTIAFRDPNLFNGALRQFGETQNNRNRLFSLGDTILLYAFLIYAQNQNSVTSEQFIRRIRIVGNLVNNSGDEITDSESRVGGNRMPAILKQVDSIVLHGQIADDLDINFNDRQLEEEKLKITWIDEHPDLAESLYELEDHELLSGQVSIVGLDHPENFVRFIKLFENCSYDAIDRAMMSIGDYMQLERKWRSQSGSHSIREAWVTLFHMSKSDGFDNTKQVLADLLSRVDEYSDDALARIYEGYLRECEQSNLFDWRYYYVKYDAFRPGRYGKYYWPDVANKPYCFIALWTKTQVSERAFYPFLKALDTDGNRYVWDMNRPYLDFGNRRLVFDNSSYSFIDAENGEEIEKYDIAQNENGIDTEDRIAKMQAILS